MKLETQNKEIIQTYFDCLAKGDMDRLGQLFADDIIWHQPGNNCLSKTYNGKSELFPLFSQFMNISQGSFKIENVKCIMVNGDHVSVILHFSANKPGMNISMDGVDILRVLNGKIKEVWLFSEDQENEDAFWGK